MPQSVVNDFHTAAAAGEELTIDLESNEIRRPGAPPVPFSIDPFRRYCLLNGLDDIDLTLEHEEKITAFEKRRVVEYPWLEAGQGVVNTGAEKASKRMDW